MLDMRIQLSGIWVALFLTYLLGDVMRIFVGDATPGKIQGMQITQAMALGISTFMLIPILMVYLSLVMPFPINRWANIIVAVVFFIFNAIGLPGYPSAFDKFLIVVGLGFNVLTVINAWGWSG
jgi:hypothetical protein